MTEHIHRTRPPIDHVPVTPPPPPPAKPDYVAYAIAFGAILFVLMAITTN